MHVSIWVFLMAYFFAILVTRLFKKANNCLLYNVFRLYHKAISLVRVFKEVCFVRFIFVWVPVVSLRWNVLLQNLGGGGD